MIRNRHVDEGIPILAAVVVLLENAAAAAWTRADGGDVLRGQLFGLGLHVAACQSLDLLDQVGASALSTVAGGASVGDADPVRLLREAEALTRSVPIDAFPPGTSALVVALCDLLREWAS